MTEKIINSKCRMCISLGIICRSTLKKFVTNKPRRVSEKLICIYMHVCLLIANVVCVHLASFVYKQFHRQYLLLSCFVVVSPSDISFPCEFHTAIEPYFLSVPRMKQANVTIFLRPPKREIGHRIIMYIN